MGLGGRTGVVAALVVLLGATAAAAKDKPERGIASWYGTGLDGHITASGEVMDRQRLTAAHRSLPFGSVIEVTNRRNGRTIIVTVNDRGPARPGRIIDLSPAAAAQLGMKKKGLALVEIRPAPFE